MPAGGAVVKPLPHPTGDEYVEARDSKLHGRGLFAAVDMPRGTRIIQYLGEKVSKAEGNRRAEQQWEDGRIYVFQLNQRQDMDGDFEYNTARLANFSCDPNAESVIIGGKIWIMARRRIKAGEEITFDYHLDFHDPPTRCRCKSPKCIGYMVGRHDLQTLRDWLAKRRRKIPENLRKRTKPRD